MFIALCRLSWPTSTENNHPIFANAFVGTEIFLSSIKKSCFYHQRHLQHFTFLCLVSEIEHNMNNVTHSSLVFSEYGSSINTVKLLNQIFYESLSYLRLNVIVQKI